jgi:hypothetical protein
MTPSCRHSVGGHCAELPDALLAKLEESIRRGYRRIAVQRYLMLQERDIEVPHVARLFCEAAIPEIRPRELQRMREAAASWVRLVRGRETWCIE